MADRTHFKHKLIGFIQDAYMMENEILQVLHRQAELTHDHPEVQAKLAQHRTQTEVQRERMATRLAAYGETPGMIREATTKVMGHMAGLTGAMRPDMLSHTLRDNYVTEHMEIAAYTALIAVAHAYGDLETVSAAKASLAEEISMAQWLFARLEMASLLDLKKLGIELPPGALANPRPTLRVTFEPVEATEGSSRI